MWALLYSTGSPPPGAPALLELAARLQDQPGPGDDVAHRAGDEHLVRAGLGGDPRRDVDGEPGEIVAPALALAGVDAGRAPRTPPTRAASMIAMRGAHRRCRRVERRDEAVAGRVHLAAAEPAELRPDDRVVRVELAPPRRVAHLGCACAWSRRCR